MAAIATILDTGTHATDVSITDIVARAGVSRPTFYKHFDDVSSLVRAAALVRLESTFARIPEASLGESWTAFAQGTFRVLLADLMTDAQFYLAALESGPSSLTADFVGYLSQRLLNLSPLGEIIRRRPGPDTPEDRADFLAAGTVWLVKQWLLLGDASPESLDTMVDRIAALLLSASGANDDEIAAVQSQTALTFVQREF